MDGSQKFLEGPRTGCKVLGGCFSGQSRSSAYSSLLTPKVVFLVLGVKACPVL